MLYSPTQQDRDTGKEAQQEWYVAQKVGCFRGEPCIQAEVVDEIETRCTCNEVELGAAKSVQAKQFC